MFTTVKKSARSKWNFVPPFQRLPFGLVEKKDEFRDKNFRFQKIFQTFCS